MKSIINIVFVLALLLSGAPAQAQTVPADYPGNYARAPRFKALIYYSDTAEEAHVDFANQAIDFFHRLSYGDGFTWDKTTSLAEYPYERLATYDVVIAINQAPGSERERAAFERYMRQGGGWVGFHAAAYNDATTHWPWYNEFLGCGTFLCNNWPPQPALLRVDGGDHPVTKNLPEEFVAPASEWYMWNDAPDTRPNVDVLLTLSPKNFPFGLKDVVSVGNYPVVWTNRDYRMIYLNMGHGDVEFLDATQNLLFVNALRWVVSRSPKGNPFDLR